MKTLATLNQQVKAAQSDAMQGARQDCGKGFYQQRGAYVLVLTPGEAIVASGELEWKGTQPQLDRIMRYTEDHRVDAIVIEGGVDFAEYKQGFAEGDYTPWATEWSVPIWERETY